MKATGGDHRLGKLADPRCNVWRVRQERPLRAGVEENQLRRACLDVRREVFAGSTVAKVDSRVDVGVFAPGAKHSKQG